MLDKRIQDIYNEYYEEETDYKALKHKYNQYMLEREDEIRERLKETKNIEDYIKYVCVGNYIDFGVTGNCPVTPKNCGPEYPDRSLYVSWKCFLCMY